MTTADIAARLRAALDADEQALTVLQSSLAAARAAVADLEATPDPTPTPVPLIPDGANLVRVAPVGSFVLAAVNPTSATNPAGAPYGGCRGPNQMVAYQLAGRPVGFRTGTNAYGVEVEVGPGGVVRSVVVGQDGGITLPTDGYVLSGHGLAAAWLRTNCRAGTVVEVLHADTPAPGPGPAPVVTDGPIRLLWQFPTPWGGPAVTSWPDDVIASITHVSFTMGQSAAAGSGKITRPADLTAMNSASLRARGIKVGATFGGSSDGGVTVTSSANASELVASVKDWPIDYLEVDLEPSGSNWVHGPLVQALQAVAATGRGIVITSGLYTSGGNDWTARWGKVCQALGDDLWAWVSMNYDFPEAGDSRLSKVTVDKLGMMRAYVPAAKAVSGFMPRPPEGYANASPAGVIPAAYAAARAMSPDSGWAVWESKISAATGWRDLRALAKL